MAMVDYGDDSMVAMVDYAGGWGWGWSRAGWALECGALRSHSLSCFEDRSL